MMKKLLLLLLIAPVLVIAQGEQRYADGTATDQDGNTFEWINYGTQDWAIENAAVETYRDGTPITQIASQTLWRNSTTGAWSYHNNDPLSNSRLYNGYSVIGIHDNDENTPNKEFAPNGWRVPSDADWTILKNYLIQNGYHYDGSTEADPIEGNKLAKSMASKTGWVSSDGLGTVGHIQSLNNSSGFNAFPAGMQYEGGGFYPTAYLCGFWTTTQIEQVGLHLAAFNYGNYYVANYIEEFRRGFSVRFVRDASTASTNNYSNAITIYPNPTTSILTIEGDKEYDIEVYNMAGNKVLETQGNSINMEHLPSATYIVKATDKSNNEELTYKVVKN